MSELKTPYLDREIEEIEEFLEINESELTEDKLKEYQSIKDILLEYELNKEGLARVCAENQELKSELQAVKAEIEKVRDESYQSAIRESGTSEQLKNMTKAWRQAQAERDELREQLQLFQGYYRTIGGIAFGKGSSQERMEEIKEHLNRWY